MSFFKTILVFVSFALNSTVHAQENIKFTEEESIPVNETFLKEHMGISKLVLASGDYEINFDENPNGRIDFKVEQIEVENEAENFKLENDFRVGIRIARRHECKDYKYDCEGCIGFRCGFITLSFFEKQSSDVREAIGKISLVENGKILRLIFTEPVDWGKMEN